MTALPQPTSSTSATTAKPSDPSTPNDSSAPGMSLADQIRATLAPQHVAIEQTAYAQALMQGNLSRRAYVYGLAQMGQIHAAVEAAWEQHSSGPVSPNDAALTRPRRTPAIERDLAALGGPSYTTIPVDPSLQPWLATLEAIGQSHPAALVGALYVLEGSRMGSMMIGRQLAKAWQIPPVPGQGLDYHLDGIATRGAEWKAFRAAVDTHPAVQAVAEAVLQLATATMDGLLVLYSGLPVAEASHLPELHQPERKHPEPHQAAALEASRAAGGCPWHRTSQTAAAASASPRPNDPKSID